MDLGKLSITGVLEGLFNRCALARRREEPVQSEPDNSFLLGHRLDNGSGEPLFLTEQDRRKHLYILGSTGAGKSNLLVRLIEHDFAQGNTAIVIDLRGDLVDRLLVRLARHEEALDRIRLVDLRQESLVFPFNPLKGGKDHTSLALHVLGIIRKESESWGVQLDETLRYSLLALCETGGTLLDLQALLTDAAFRARILSQTRDPYVRSFFDRYCAMSAERQQSWSLPVLNKVSAFWTVPLVRQMLAASQPPKWSDWIDSPGRLVCVALAAHRLQSAGQLVGSLLVSSLQNAIMARADSPESARNQVTLYIDEFETMASPAFKALIAEGRRFGASLVLAHQNLTQVEATLRQTIRNNVQTQIIFQCGSPDASELSGEIMADEPKEAIRRSLVQQSVGEAYVVRRGQRSLQVATVHSPDPKESVDRVAAIKAELLQRTCLPAQHFMAVAPTARTEEVRHVRRPKA